MVEYELSVNIMAENEEAVENLFITVESINNQSDTIGVAAVELLSISGLKLSNKAKCNLNLDTEAVTEYEQDSWLSPLSVKKLPDLI